jgi:hypothetical protein
MLSLLSLSLLLFFVEELSKGCQEFRGFVTRAVVAKNKIQGIFFFLCRCSSRLICRCSLRLRKKKEEQEEGEGEVQEQESEEVP